jgi:hypothetical protein
MRARPLSRSIVSSCAVLLASCATTTRVERLSSSYPARESGCEVAFFQGAKPDAPYEAIGKIESHIARNFFLGGKPQLGGEGNEELRRKACDLGGDAVIVDDFVETSASEMAHLHIWATVIRLPKK